MDVSEDFFIKQVGLQIKKLREGLNLTQEDLANDCNIPKSQIGRIERGEINTTLKTLYKLSKALGVTPSVIIASSQQ